MNYGEVQGPINREPEEKLDPSIKQNQATSGIRRLYVSDSNHLNVVDVDLCLNIRNLLYKLRFKNCINAIIQKNSKLDTPSLNSFSKPLSTHTNFHCSCASNRLVYCLLNNCFKNSFSFFIVFLVNLVYLFICFNMNKLVLDLFTLCFSCFLLPKIKHCYFIFTFTVLFVLRLKYSVFESHTSHFFYLFKTRPKELVRG